MLTESPGPRAERCFEDSDAAIRIRPFGVRRALERRVRRWRTVARSRTGGDVMFGQRHQPGRVGLSGFTAAKKLAVLIGGKLLTTCCMQIPVQKSH